MDLALTRDELFNNPPWYFYLKQAQYNRKLERGWDYVRTIMAMQLNTAMGNKKRYRPDQIMKLSYDKRYVQINMPSQDEINAMITKWN
jgi:hypothetical protein